MSTARERVQQEADARWPLTPNVWEDQHNRDRRGAFIAGRTVTPEMVEQAARAVWGAPHDDGDHYAASWDDIEDQAIRDSILRNVRTAFTAAGLIVEEE